MALYYSCLISDKYREKTKNLKKVTFRLRREILHGIIVELLDSEEYSSWSAHQRKFPSLRLLYKLNRWGLKKLAEGTLREDQAESPLFQNNNTARKPVKYISQKKPTRLDPAVCSVDLYAAPPQIQHKKKPKKKFRQDKENNAGNITKSREIRAVEQKHQDSVELSCYFLEDMMVEYILSKGDARKLHKKYTEGKYASNVKKYLACFSERFSDFGALKTWILSAPFEEIETFHQSSCEKALGVESIDFNTKIDLTTVINLTPQKRQKSQKVGAVASVVFWPQKQAKSKSKPKNKLPTHPNTPAFVRQRRRALFPTPSAVSFER